MRLFIHLFIAASLGFGVSSVSIADDEINDSSADAIRGFTDKVEASKGFILRVPINEDGEEYNDGATARLHVDGTDVADPDDIAAAWEESMDINNQPQLDDDELSDSSTWGWWGWRGRGWSRPYYYYSYRPSYNYYGYRYTYSTPVYYTTYNYNPYYYGYRYYYYNCW